MQKSKIFCFAVGAAMLVSAVSLTAYNYYEDNSSGETAKSILSQMKDVIPEATEISVKESLPEGFDDIFAEYETEMPYDAGELEIDGAAYIGYVRINKLNIELPIMSEWNYPNLKISPCRYKGSIMGNDLILAAHNYNSHFGQIKSLTDGDLIEITDAKGRVHSYRVISIEEISGTDVEAMDFGSAESWDLTLFTCTLSGQSRVTIRAERFDPNEYDISEY